MSCWTKNTSKSRSNAMSIIASTGSTPRRRASSATVGLGRYGDSRMFIRLEPGAPGFRSVRLAVVAVMGGVDEPAPYVGIAKQCLLLGVGKPADLLPFRKAVEPEPGAERLRRHDPTAMRERVQVAAARSRLVHELERGLGQVRREQPEHDGRAARDRQPGETRFEVAVRARGRTGARAPAGTHRCSRGRGSRPTPPPRPTRLAVTRPGDRRT